MQGSAGTRLGFWAWGKRSFSSGAHFCDRTVGDGLACGLLGRACFRGHAGVMQGSCGGRGWSRRGRALVVRWPCGGHAVVMRWPGWSCGGHAVVARWSCGGHAVVMQWSCGGHAVVMRSFLKSKVMQKVCTQSFPKSKVMQKVRMWSTAKPFFLRWSSMAISFEFYTLGNPEIKPTEHTKTLVWIRA